MKAMIMITAQILRDLLHYDPDTGVFTWRVQVSNVTAGTVAGKSLPTGYRVIRIRNRVYYAHRLAWLYMTGDWPAHQIDHVNNSTGDNRWANLRAATQAQNNANCRVRSSTGFKGVYRYGKRFASFARYNGKSIYLGTFSTAAEASNAYVSKARELFGEFARAA